MKGIRRPRSTTKKVDQRINDLASTNNSATTRGIQRVPKRKNVDISQETIRRRLKKYGAKFSLPISKSLLTEKHRQKRFEWAHAAGDMDWNRIIFSDEPTVRLNQLKKHVWNLPKKRKVFRTVKYLIKVNIWGCFSCNGFGHVCCFRENLKTDLLCRIYKRYLLSTASDHFGRNSTNLALQEDNDPKHTSQLAKQWRSKYEVQRIDWPSMSLDLNLIKNVWKLLKMNLARKNLRTYKSLVSAIKKRMESFSKRSNNQSCAKYEKSYFWCYF